MASGAALKHLREGASSRDSARPSLILIDDDPLIVDSLSFLLGAQFDVQCASSRPQARKLLQALPVAPALALVDLGLPPKPHAPDEGFALITELLAFNRAMVERHRVATVPGFAFGLTDTHRANYQRLSYGALDAATVAEGVQRFVAAVRDWYRP